MCGIVAIINTTNAHDVPFKLIHQMNDVLNHRGPDGSGTWRSQCNKVSFGHKRLSIIDLSTDALQPMVSLERQYALIFNGEIYNYKELREDCIHLGSKFISHSDTEVIIECYRHWGSDCFHRFRGMWAIILYDVKKNEVIVSRDPFAIKPLYYGFFKGHFYFASEPKALTQLSEYFKEEDLTTTQLFLKYGYLDREDWTFYKNIKRFPHATYAKINLDVNKTQMDFIKYWKPSSVINYSITFSQAVKKLRELLFDSMELHLRSDVPIGSCLSGGIDSSGIVSMGTKLLKGNPFTTFTSYYSQFEEINERKWAQAVINHTNATAYFIEPTKESLKQNLDDLIWAQDEPFGSMSIFAQYCVFKKIGDTNIKVVLDGQGADEMLGGYLGFLPIYFYDLARKGKMLTLIKEYLAFKDMNIQFDIKDKLKLALKNSMIKTNKKIVHQNNEVLHDKDELSFRLNKLSLSFEGFEDNLESLLCESNIPQLLRYEDRNSMRFSIESRVPFINTEIVEFVLSLPANYRIRNGYTKAVLREALKGIIPDAVRKRRDKLGFPAPEVQWMKECYDIDVPSTGSLQWREFIHKRWCEMKNRQTNAIKEVEVYS
ncbi:MAG: asparagine synthase (glutamine-hydrolyzing) [Legionella sp.]|nr:asparagine synthase (glutamine-hydrolyzing) [Legionella sp.]